MGESGSRLLPEYQQRRLMWFCAVAAVWIICTFVAGAILGTLLALMLAGIITTIRFAFTDWWQQASSALAQRPWRNWDEMLDVSAAKLSSAIRRTLHDTLVAAPLVEIVYDMTTLMRLAERLGLAQAEAELTERYRLLYKSLGATTPTGERPTVTVRGDAALALGRVELIPHFGAPVQNGDSGAATVKAPHHPATRTYEDETVFVDDRLRLRLPDGDRVFGVSTVISVGRGSMNTIDLTAFADDRMSRLHAEFRWSGTCWLLLDKSRNGILLNGAQVLGQTEIHPGQEIKLGRSHHAPVLTVLPALKNQQAA